MERRHRKSEIAMPWYYAHQEQRIGPVAEEELRELARKGTITPSSLVWRDGMAEWQPWAVAGPAAFSGHQLCQGCGGLFPNDDLVQLQGALVCAACKPLHLQRIREGALPVGDAGVSQTFGEGKRLVIALGQPLPPRCVCCNEAATLTRRRKYYWYPPWLFILLLLSPLILVLVGLIVQRRTTLDLPLCDNHVARRRKRLWIAWGWGIASVAGLIGFPLLGGLIGSVSDYTVWLAVACFISMIVALFWGNRAASVLSVHRIGKQTASFTRASPEFLASLPKWPGGPVV